MKRNSKELKYAPQEVFGKILEYAVIPTFDLVIEYGSQGVIIVRREIAPYRRTWALPGLRMMKPESISDTLRRIARQELGLKIEPQERVFLGQYVGQFRTENQRQDLSTGYLLRASADQPIILNREHFSGYRIVSSAPQDMGAMYKFYLKQYLALR